METSSVALPLCFSYTSFLLVKSKVIYMKQILFLWIFPQMFSSCARYFLCFWRQIFFMGADLEVLIFVAWQVKIAVDVPQYGTHTELHSGGVYLLSSLNEDRTCLDFEFYSSKYQWLCLLSNFSFLLSPNLTFFPLRGLISVFISVWAGFPQWHFSKALVFVQLVLSLQVFLSKGENIDMLGYLFSVLLPLFQRLQAGQKLCIFSGEGNSGQV